MSLELPWPRPLCPAGSGQCRSETRFFRGGNELRPQVVSCSRQRGLASSGPPPPVLGLPSALRGVNSSVKSRTVPCAQARDCQETWAGPGFSLPAWRSRVSPLRRRSRWPAHCGCQGAQDDKEDLGRQSTAQATVPGKPVYLPPTSPSQEAGATQELPCRRAPCWWGSCQRFLPPVARTSSPSVRCGRSWGGVFCGSIGPSCLRGRLRVAAAAVAGSCSEGRGGSSEQESPAAGH